MKLTLLFTLSVFWALTNFNPLFAQWIQTGSLSAGTIHVLAPADSSKIIAGMDKGIFSSTDNGTNWDESDQGLFRDNIICLAESPISHTLFAAGGQEFYRSTDHGNSWASVNSSPWGQWYPSAYAIIADSIGNIFVGTYLGVYKSTDDGQTWQACNNGFPAPITTESFTVESFVITPNGHIFAGTYGFGVWRSTDDGSSWSQAGNITGEIVYSLASDAKGDLFAGTQRDGVYRSTDGGNSWTWVSNSFPRNFGIIATITGLAVDSNNYVYAGSDGVYRSEDDGTSWLNIGLSGIGIYSLTTEGGCIYAGTYDGRIFRSGNQGNSWSLVDSNAAAQIIQSLLVDPAGNIYTATLNYGMYGAGIFESTDNGESWMQVSKGIATPPVRAIATTSFGMFACTDKGICKSIDGGRSWSIMNGSPAGQTMALTKQGDILVGTGSGLIFRSQDHGNTWNVVDSGLTAQPVNCFAIDSTRNILAGTGGGLFRSTNNGTSWVASAISDTNILSLATNQEAMFAGTSGGVFLSTDNGESWTPVNTGLPNIPVTSLVVTGVNVFAGNEDGDFLSSNNGANWTNVSNGLTGPYGAISVSSLAIVGTDLFAGLWNGAVWKRPLSEMITSVNQDGNVPPKMFLLCQNYPNPFNPSTIITYQLPHTSFVTLRVYDVLGREVATLVNERQTAGSHSVAFNAATLPSGVYFYRLQAGTFTQTKKLTVVK